MDSQACDSSANHIEPKSELGTAFFGTLNPLFRVVKMLENP